MNNNFILRFAKPEDLPLIFSSWLKSHRDIFFKEHETGTDSQKDSELLFRKTRFINHDDTKFMTRERYFSSYKRHINKLVENSMVLLACDPDTPSQIYGYIVYQKLGDFPIVHYAYTKHIYRKLGLMRRLLVEINPNVKTNPTIVTFYNALVRDLRTKYNLVFDPYVGGY